MKKLFLAVALLGTLIPIAFVIREAGGWQNWRGVLPRGTTDSLYYYSRIHEVVDGHPTIGNPYVYEYRDNLSPAFFLSDIISSIPALLGIPFNMAVMINIFVWSFIFLFLLFTLFKLLNLPNRWAVSSVLLVYITGYSFMLRPTVMQIVYPMFIVFLIAFLNFLYEPLSRKRIICLALASALSFYIYTFLSYLVFISLAFIFFWHLVTKRFKELRSLIFTGLLTAFALVPFGIVAILQAKNTFYLETLRRLGLIYTHVPSSEAYLYGRWVMIGLIVTALVWKLATRIKDRDAEQKIFWLATGTSLFISLFLNVITGVEMTLAVHIGRFVILWMVMVLTVLAYEWYLERPIQNKTKYAIVAVFLLVLTAGVMRNIPRGIDFFKFNSRGTDRVADIQHYSGPLIWLDKNVAKESVIWTNDSLSQYIPIMTKHYPLFAPGSQLQNISNQELEDRYLLSRSLHTLTIEDIKRDFALYAGRGPAIEEPRIAKITAIELRGEEYFKNLSERFITIKENQPDFLDKFNVRYILFDRTHDNVPTTLENVVYDDGRFVIVERNSKGQ